MPLQADARTAASSSEGPYRRIVLEAPSIANRLHPGQFVTTDLGDPVRTPLLPAKIAAECVDFLLPHDHPAAALQTDNEVNLIGPLGKGIRLPKPPTRLLLVADGPRLPALLPMAYRALDDGCPVTLLLNVAAAADIYPPALLPAAMEIHVVTGKPADPTSDLLLWADQVLVATDPAHYLALAETIRDTRMMPAPDFAQALMMPTIVCGVGACRSCGVRTYEGTPQACTDGPFFNLLELEVL